MAWEAQFARLAAHKVVHGDCNVPQRWAEDPQLGTWVSTQRFYKKELDRGEPSQCMTAARVAKLEALGFAWQLASGNRRHAMAPTAPEGMEEEVEEDGGAAAGEAIGRDAVEAAQVLSLMLDSYAGSSDISSHGSEEEEESDPGQSGAPIVHSKYTQRWEVWLTRLVAYKAEHGDCSVPRGWAEDPRLASWVDKQRVYKRALDRGEPSLGMTEARAARLTALGLDWAPLRSAAPRGAADGEGGAAASSTSGISDMMVAIFDCGACGKEEEWHTWFDGWEGPCYEGKCERCYLSSEEEASQDGGQVYDARMARHWVGKAVVMADLRTGVVLRGSHGYFAIRVDESCGGGEAKLAVNQLKIRTDIESAGSIDIAKPLTPKLKGPA
jgi:hypothetical protein